MCQHATLNPHSWLCSDLTSPSLDFLNIQYSGGMLEYQSFQKKQKTRCFISFSCLPAQPVCLLQMLTPQSTGARDTVQINV